MKKTCSFFVALAVLLVAAPVDAAKRQGAESRAQSLDEVNQALVGRTVNVELFAGKTVRRAKSVRVEPDFTRWDSVNGPEQVLTSQVRRVSIRSPIPKSVASGLVLGALFGLDVVYNHLETEGSPVDSGVRAVIVKGSILGGAALGGILGARTVMRRWHVVYEAPIDRYLSGSELGLREPLEATAHLEAG